MKSFQWILLYGIHIGPKSLIRQSSFASNHVTNSPSPYALANLHLVLVLGILCVAALAGSAWHEWYLQVIVGNKFNAYTVSGTPSACCRENVLAFFASVLVIDSPLLHGQLMGKPKLLLNVRNQQLFSPMTLYPKSLNWTVIHLRETSGLMTIPEYAWEYSS